MKLDDLDIEIVPCSLAITAEGDTQENDYLALIIRIVIYSRISA